MYVHTYGKVGRLVCLLNAIVQHARLQNCKSGQGMKNFKFRFRFYDLIIVS